MKKLRKFWVQHWRRNVFLVFAAASSAGLLLPRLASLAPRFSPAEQQTLAHSAQLRSFIDNPLHAPLKLLQWLGQQLPGHTIAGGRLSSVLLGIFSVAIFIYILRRWYGPRTTLFGFIIFVTSAWFLHVSRYAGTDIEYLFAVLLLLAAHVGLYHHQRPLMFYGWLFAQIVLVFIPGMVWFVVLNMLWQRRDIAAGWRACTSRWQQAGWIGLSLVGFGAMGAVLVRTPELIRPWLGLPDRLAAPLQLLHSFGETLLFINIRGPYDPAQWLDRLPLLDVFLSVMLIAGIVFYARHWQAARTRLLAVYLLVGAILASLGGAVRFSVIVPIIYLIATAGIAYILHQWLSVFPRNPLARGVGIGIVLVTIALSSTYNLRHYFVAWPHNPAVQHIYRDQR